jgi:hypothetical protein
LALFLVLLALIFWLRSRKIAVAWYSWVLAGIGVLLLLFTIWNVSTSLAEYETVAARTSLWLFGTPALILLGMAIFLSWWRSFKKLKKAAAK